MPVLQIIFRLVQLAALICGITYWIHHFIARIATPKRRKFLKSYFSR